jgi:hypothetical protein
LSHRLRAFFTPSSVLDELVDRLNVAHLLAMPFASVITSEMMLGVLKLLMKLRLSLVYLEKIGLVAALLKFLKKSQSNMSRPRVAFSADLE